MYITAVNGFAIYMIRLIYLFVSRIHIYRSNYITPLQQRQ